VIKGIIFLSALIAALIFIDYLSYKDDMVYIKVCDAMGGQAVLGRRGTNHCLSTADLMDKQNK
jgi:hypothetical protein